jgi:hypothetical protein
MTPAFRTVRIAAILLALLPAASLVACAAAKESLGDPVGTIEWACDFEGTYCGMVEQSKIEPAHRSRFVANARNGSQAIELTTLPGDDEVHGSGSWERDDLLLPKSADYCNEGQDEWWAFSVLFPDSFSEPTLGDVMDFHAEGSHGQPNLNLVVSRGRLLFHGFYRDLDNPGEYKAELGAVRRNRWYDFVIHAKWSSKDDGFMIAWLGGKKVLVHRGATLYPGRSCYLKLANYHTPTRKPSSIVFDRVIRGTSAAAVARGKLER